MIDTHKKTLCIASICLLLVVITIIIIAVAFPCSSDIKQELNSKPGCINDHFCRQVIEPRSGYESRVEDLNLTFHDEPSIEWSDCEEDAYWNEEGAIMISQ